MTTDPLLTVAICTHNGSPLLREAVASVVSQIDDDTQVLIVENASTDDTRDVAESLAASHACIRVVAEPRLGLSYARNTALKTARGPYVVFLDDDAVAEAGWLAGYRQFFETRPAHDIAAAGGAVTPRYARPAPRWLGHWKNRLEIEGSARPMNGRNLPWGCNFGCDRLRALAVGGFAIALGRHGSAMGAHEETDLFHRLRAAGYSVWWLPDAPIEHHIAPHRLRVGYVCYSAFSSGRSSVILRLRKHHSRWRQSGLLVGRLVAMPVASALYLVVAILGAPLRHGQITVRSMASAARSFGIFSQFLLEAPHILAGNWSQDSPRHMRTVASASTLEQRTPY